MGFLSSIGKDFTAVFAWLGSSKGKATIAVAETAAVGVATAVGAGVPVAAGIALLNNWMGEAITVESIAAAAAQQTGTGPQKAAAVLSKMVPQLATYLEGKGYTSAQIDAHAVAINSQVVALLNLLGQPAA